MSRDFLPGRSLPRSPSARRARPAAPSPFRCRSVCPRSLRRGLAIAGGFDEMRWLRVLLLISPLLVTTPAAAVVFFDDDFDNHLTNWGIGPSDTPRYPDGINPGICPGTNSNGSMCNPAIDVQGMTWAWLVPAPWCGRGARLPS